MGGFQALFFQVPKFFQQENCGGRRPWSRRAPQEIRSQNGSPGGLDFKIATLTHTPCPQNWSNKSPIETSFQVTSLKLGLSASCHNLSQAAASTTSMRQVAQNQQSLKLRHHSIMVHRTNRGLHRGGATSATTPEKRHQKAANQELPWDFMRFLGFLKWLSPNLIQIVSLILGFLATCGDTCGVSIWSWPLDKRHIHRCWNSASPSLTSDFRLRIFLEVCDDFGFRIWFPNQPEITKCLHVSPFFKVVLHNVLHLVSV